jgi:hypothetical protein
MSDATIMAKYRERLSEIEDEIARGHATPAWVFTQLRQLLAEASARPINAAPQEPPRTGSEPCSTEGPAVAAPVVTSTFRKRK